MKKKKRILPFYFCMIFALIFSQVIHIYGLNELEAIPSDAQNPTSIPALSEPYITLDLDKTSAGVGDIIKASVRINQINNFAGYQVNIKYDPSVLQAVNPITGDAFKGNTEPLTGNILVNKDYSPYYYLLVHDINNGVLNFARMYSNIPAYMEGGAPETTGIIAVIGFRVVSSNISTTSIRFTDTPSMESAISGTILFDWDFNKISDYSVIQAPDIDIISGSPIPTVSPKYKISGYIAPDFETDSSQSTDIKAGFKVEVVGTGFNAQTNSNGYFEIADIPFSAQGYSLKIRKDGYLYRIINVAVINDVQIASADAPLAIWAGDMIIDGVCDNVINIADIMEVVKCFNSSVSDERYNASCDINQDKAINIIDITILAKHFNKSVNDYPGL